jgi:hypothetical protein
MLFPNFLSTLLYRPAPQPTLDILPQSSAAVAVSRICLVFFDWVNILDLLFLGVGQFEMLKAAVN